MDTPLITLDDHEAASARLKDITRRGIGGGPFYILGFLGTVFSSSLGVENVVIVATVTTLFALLGIARFVVAAKVAAKPTIGNNKYLNSMFVIYITSALLWCLSSAWIYTLNPTIDIVITLNVMATAGITMGGIGALASCSRLQNIYCFLMSVPLAVAAACLLDGPGNGLIASFIAAYGMFGWWIGRTQSQAYSQALSDNLKLSVQAEELTKAKIAAEQAGQTKTNFLAAMTHEIRTPMNGVLGMSQLLAMGHLDEEQQQQVAVINNAGATLLHIIDNILDYSKMDAGKLELGKHSFNPANVLDEVNQLLSMQAKQKSIQLKITAADVPAFIEGDPYRFYQILFNLVGNAIKFTDRGSVVVEMTSRTAAQADRCVITVRISDTGVGISEQEQQHIFEQFHQVSQFSPDIRGTGLGLSITQSLVELMGGNIEVQSTVGVGTVFTVKLPFSCVEASLPDAILATDPSAADNNAAGVAKQQLLAILLVEDNLTNQMICSQFLQKLGCKVDIAETGKVALDKFSNHRYQAIFMDCNMPEMDGFVATQAIRSLEQQRQLVPTPIIALTAHVQEEVKQQCIKVGMDNFLSKPFLFDELKAIIAAIRVRELA